MLCGGLVLVGIAFSLIGVVNFAEHPVIGLVFIAMAVFFAVVMINYARSEKRGNTRWADRERRGF